MFSVQQNTKCTEDKELKTSEVLTVYQQLACCYMSLYDTKH